MSSPQVTFDWNNAQPIQQAPEPQQPPVQQSAPVAKQPTAQPQQSSAVSFDWANAQPVAAPSADTFGNRLSDLIQHPIATLTGSTPGYDANDKGEQDKTRIWSQAAADFKAGNFRKSAGDLLDLFKPNKNAATAESMHSTEQGAIGFTKGAGQTAATIGDVGTLGLTHLIPENKKDTSLEPSNPDQAVGANIESIIEFAMGDAALKGLSLADRLAQGSKLADVLEKYPRIASVVGNAIRTGTVGGVVGGVHGGVQGAEEGAATGALIGGGTAALGELGQVGKKLLFGGDYSQDYPGLVNEIRNGKGVAQPSAQDAVRNAVRMSALNSDADIYGGGTRDIQKLGVPFDAPILEDGSTVLDDHLKTLKAMERDAYDKVDDVVGFDLKAEKAQLANDTYKLGQLGNTDADITQRGNLIEAINDSEQRIAEAEANLQKAGIDPQYADGLHQKRMAGQDFKKMLVNATNADGVVNIDQLIEASKNLRFTKYGDRLAQFMGGTQFGGTQLADGYMNSLIEAQKQGIHAVKMQKLLTWVGRGIGIGAGITGGSEIIRGLTGH